MTLWWALQSGRPWGQSSTNRLIGATKALVEVLNEVDNYPALYFNRRILRRAVYRYEHRWIPLLHRVSPSRRTALVPPLDIEWVWFCHMLCPIKYISDSAAMWKAVDGEEEIVIDHRLSSGHERKAGQETAARLWMDMFPDEPFHVFAALTNAPIRETEAGDEDKVKQKRDLPESRITYDIAAAAETQMAFHYQVGVMPQYKDDKFLKHAVKRYSRMFLKLQRQFSGQVWVPTYDIDVVWHAHMLHPIWYMTSTGKIRGSVLPHDDTLNDRSPGSRLNSRWEATMKQWKRLFLEPINRHGAMWRGNVEVEERTERPHLVRLIQRVEDKCRALSENGSGSSQRSGTQTELSFSVAFGGDTNWEMSTEQWVHMTDWRGGNRTGRTLAPGREDKVERVTFLTHPAEPIVLTSRSMHFIIYNIRNSPSDFRSVLEVYGASNTAPVATAHHILPFTLCKPISKASTPCQRRLGENVLLLRIGGQDFGLLGGTWTDFIAPRKGTSYSQGTRGAPGSLQLRLWLLGDNSTDEWLCISRTGGSKEPGRFSFRLPVEPSGSSLETRSVSFDLNNATVKVEHESHVIPVYLISMVAAMLHVTLQPRFLPNGGARVRSTETMYPEWSAPQDSYVMLRGAGGERKDETGNRGLWVMLLQILHAENSSESRFFAGSVAGIRAPSSQVAGGCGGRGGGQGRGRSGGASGGGGCEC